MVFPLFLAFKYFHEGLVLIHIFILPHIRVPIQIWCTDSYTVSDFFLLCLLVICLQSSIYIALFFQILPIHPQSPLSSFLSSKTLPSLGNYRTIGIGKWLTCIYILNICWFKCYSVGWNSKFFRNLCQLTDCPMWRPPVVQRTKAQSNEIKPVWQDSML